MATVISVSSC